jgi:hypothetical protein
MEVMGGGAGDFNRVKGPDRAVLLWREEVDWAPESWEELEGVSERDGCHLGRVPPFAVEKAAHTGLGLTCKPF